MVWEHTTEKGANSPLLPLFIYTVLKRKSEPHIYDRGYDLPLSLKFLSPIAGDVSVAGADDVGYGDFMGFKISS